MRNNRRSLAFKDDDADPLSVVVNLFDVAMVFAVALMVSMVMNLNMQDFFSGEDFTIVKKKGDDMEIIRREGQKVTKYKTVEGATAPDASQKRGKRLGIMYETDTGETILVND
mgnify:FL=1